MMATESSDLHYSERDDCYDVKWWDCTQSSLGG